MEHSQLPPLKGWRLALAVLLYAASALAQAPEDSPNSLASPTPLIMLGSDMTMQLTSDAAVSFSADETTAYANSLRSALSTYNVMSVVVGNTQAGDRSINVTTRLVNAPADGQTLSQEWQAFAYDLFVSGTLLPSIESALQSQGLLVQPSIISAVGAPDTSQPQVQVMVNMTLAGASIDPFSADKQTVLTDAFNQVLGQRATDGAHIRGYSTAANDSQVAVQIELKLYPDGLPQLWMFLYNSSQVHSALAPLSPQLNASVTGALATEVQANAPSPLGQTQPGTPLQAAPPTNPPVNPGGNDATPPEGSQSPVSAGSVTGSAPTVTLNLAMQIDGSTIVPFNAQAQFAAASSMAAVFSIITGTGAVQILSYDEGGDDGAAPTTAGRRRLLASASFTATRQLLQAESMPGVMVDFAVSLPEASASSLLVTQSQSSAVRAQFAGWFAMQMQARGYDVNATVQSINTAPSASLIPLAPMPGPTPPSQASAPTPPSGSSHVGAIVGGVIGGVAAVALLGALVAFFVLRRRWGVARGGKSFSMPTPRTMSSDAANKMESFKSDSTVSAEFRPGKQDALEPSQLRPFPAVLASSGTDATSRGLATKGTFTGPDAIHTASSEDIKRLLQRQRQRTYSPLTSASETPSEHLERVLSPLGSGSTFANKYTLLESKLVNSMSLISFAVTHAEPRQQVAIKFFAMHDHFRHEKLFYENRAALDTDPSSTRCACLIDVLEGGGEWPPALVLECGEFTLQDWSDGAAKMASDVDRVRILYDTCKSLEFLHLRSIVHWSFGPRAVMWFPQPRSWKLVSLGTWARSGERASLQSTDIHCSAPEVLAADLVQENTFVADEAADMWGLGLIAFELLAGRPLFSERLADQVVLSMLLGVQPLPWEADPLFFHQHLERAAATFVADLLMRMPEARKPIRTVIHSPLFERIFRDSAFDTNLATASSRSLALSVP